MHDYGHVVVEWSTKTMLSNVISCNLTACYLPKQQPLSKSLPNALPNI
jgi:hypothetical protein